jgi:hypothetical protein
MLLLGIGLFLYSLRRIRIKVNRKLRTRSHKEIFVSKIANLK